MRLGLIRFVALAIVALTPFLASGDDNQIASEIMSRLRKEKAAGSLRGFGVNVQVEDGTVFLKGHVSNPQQQDLLLSISRHAEGVQQVVNGVEIRNAEPVTVAVSKDSAPQNVAAAEPKPVAIPQPSQFIPQDVQPRRIAPIDKSDKPMYVATPSPQRAQSNLPVQLASSTSQAKVTEELDLNPQTLAWDSSPEPEAKEAVAPVFVSNPVIEAPKQEEQSASAKANTPSQVSRIPATLATAPQASTPAPVFVRAPAPQPAPAQLQPAPPQNPLACGPQGPHPGQCAACGNPGYPQQHYNQYAAPVRPVAYTNSPVAFAPAQGVPPHMAPVGNPYARQMAMQAAMQQQGGPSPYYVPASAQQAQPQYDHPQMPAYAWPAYASHPNYAAVTYPKQYSPTAWPYIGPFYPYPQVPLGWRKVTLEWDDGWWMLDFKDR